MPSVYLNSKPLFLYQSLGKPELEQFGFMKTFYMYLWFTGLG